MQVQAVAPGVLHRQGAVPAGGGERHRLKGRHGGQVLLDLCQTAGVLRLGSGLHIGLVQLLEDLSHAGHAFHQPGADQIQAKGAHRHQHQAGGQSGAGPQHPLGKRPDLDGQLVGQTVKGVLHRLEIGLRRTVHLEFPFQPLFDALITPQVIFSHGAPPPFPSPVPHRLPGIFSARERAAASRPPR